MIPGIPLGQAVGEIKDGQIEMKQWEKDKLLACLNSSYDEARKFYEPIRIRWYLTERFLEGYQTASPIGSSEWVSADYQKAKGQSKDVDDEDFVDNVLIRAYMMMVMRLTRQDLALDVQPNSLNEADRNACRMGRIALYDLLDRNNIQRLKIKRARNLIVYGKSFLKITFNPNKGPWIKRPKIKIVGIDPMTQAPIEEIEMVDAQEGQVQIDVICPRNITVPPNCTSLDTADWVQETNIRSIEHVYREYGVTIAGEKIAPDQMEFSTPFSMTGGKGVNGDSAELNSVLLKERVYRPSPNFPNGAIVAWVGKTILRSSTLTDYYDEIFYFDEDMVYVEGSFWSDTPFYHALPHQEELNRLETEIMRHTKVMCKPKILMKKGTKVGAADFTDETGEFLEYIGDTKPEYLEAPELPQAVYENMNRVLTRLQEILGVHDMSRPNRSLSGNAIAYFQELDESILAPVIKGDEAMWEKGLSFALKLMGDFYDTPRMCRMFNQNRYQIEEEFKGAFLNENFSATVSMSQGLPANMLARQQFLFQAVDKQILAPEKAANYLDIGDAREALREVNMEREICEKVTRQLESGVLIPARPWDNHGMYIEVMVRHMREKWEDYPQNVRDIFLMVLAAHQQAQAAMMNPGNSAAGPLAGMITPSMPLSVQGGGTGGGRGQASGAQPPKPGGPPSDQQANQAGTRGAIVPPSAGMRD